MDVLARGQPCRQNDREAWTACFGNKQAGREGGEAGSSEACTLTFSS